MLRERKESVNPAEELVIIMKQHFPKLYNWIDELTDTRQEWKITYSLKCVIMIRIFAACCGIKTMNEITTDFNTEETIKNINLILNENNLEIPHRDTIVNILKQLDYKELEKIQTKMIKQLMRDKVLDQFRYSYKFKEYFHIAIDGTGLFTCNYDLGPKAIKKVYNKGTDKEYTTYSYYVLEAKIICGDMVFSVASEFVENSIIIDENGNEIREFDKQDCELKAAHRLLLKIKQMFPKTPIIIGGDALYANNPFFELCKKLKFEFVIRYKDTTIPTIAQEFENIEKTVTTVKDDGIYEFANDVVYGNDIKNGFNTINVIRYTPTTDEELVDYDENESVAQVFTFITSMKIDINNQKNIVIIGRNRWKIENQGFRDQKKGVIDIEHIYTRDYTATKNNYILLQMAHLFLTLLNMGSVLIKQLMTTKKEVSKLLKTALTNKIINLNVYRKIQLRLL